MTDLLQPFKKLRDDWRSYHARQAHILPSSSSRARDDADELDAAITEAKRLLATPHCDSAEKWADLIQSRHSNQLSMQEVRNLAYEIDTAQHEAVAKATEKMDKLLLSVLDGYCSIGRARDHYKAILAERGKQ